MTVTPVRVLIVGGYGVFGGRLARLLADLQSLTLVIAGRSQSKALAFVDELNGAATFEAARFDRDGDAAAGIAQLRPDIIIDASGPFQDYGHDRGRDPYVIVKAALDAGVNYLDFADGSAFVDGIAQFDSAAKAAGIFIVSGVSSFPVLTAAVVRELANGLEHVDHITGGIAPSPYAGVGENVIRAVAGYAGKPVALMRSGAPATGYGLTETRRLTIAPPGLLPLKSKLFSLVDVPDLRVLPPLWPGLSSIWMGAGPVPEILHRGLIVLATAVRFKLLPSLSRFSPLFLWATNTLRWGEHRGGMIVRVEGRKPGGQHTVRTWHLIAEGDDGPLIPAMALEAVVRKSAGGMPPAPGARSAAKELTLADYAPAFAGREIYTGVREEDASGSAKPLYKRILGSAWGRLPPEIRAMHDVTTERTVEGRADVERGSSLLSRIFGWIIGFPEAARDVPVKVRFTASNGVETWWRTFGARSFSSVQSAGEGRSAHLINERFGIVTVGLAAVVSAERLTLVVRRWSCLGVPLPMALAPSGDAYEYAENGRFRFNVEIKAPFAGLIVRYRGYLVAAP